MQFDFDKIPANQYDAIVRAINGHNTTALVLIHEKYNLSDDNLCCSGQKYVSEAYTLFENWAIQKGLIQNED